jgi:cobaltochelatase CobN
MKYILKIAVCSAVFLLLCNVCLFAGKKTRQNIPVMAFIGLHGGVFDQLRSYEKELGVRVKYIEDQDITSRKADLSDCDILFLQHLRSEDKENYKAVFKETKAKYPAFQIFSFQASGADMFRDLDAGNAVFYNPELSAYYNSSSRENARRLLIYAKVKLLGLKGRVLPPEPIQNSGIYHPDHKELFNSTADFLKWASGRKNISRMPRALVAVHYLHLVFQQPKVVDAIIRALEKRGILAAAAIDIDKSYETLASDFKPDVVVHTCHSPDTEPFREKLDAPHLTSIFFRKQSIAEWRTDVQGLPASDSVFQVTGQEILGTIEPQIGAGTINGGGSDSAFTPIPERIEHLAARAAAWIKLRVTPNSKKHISIVYYDREMGKHELMRGSTTGMFMNAPRSLVKVLKRMKDDGYTVSTLPKDDVELIGWMQERGRQMGVWMQDSLEKYVKAANPVLIPADRYEKWLNERVPEDLRKQLTEKWGPPPGKFMVWTNKRGKKFIVVPRIDLGNVILLPQPLRGEANDVTLLHDHLIPPPHNYLATYFWLEKEFGADALVHFGTHGSEFLLPGKWVGLSDRDWSDIIMGAMPNINPWIIENLGEAPIVKHRAYAVTISHMTPPIVNAEISDDLLNVSNDIGKFDSLEQGPLRENFRKLITGQVLNSNLDKDLHFDLKPGALLSDAQIEKTAKYMHDISNDMTPVSLHVLGEPPEENLLIPYLVTCLRKKFLDDLALVFPVPREENDKYKYLRNKAEVILEQVVRKGASPQAAIKEAGGAIKGDVVPEEVGKSIALAVELNGRFAKTGLEIDNLMGALSGRFVPPGPGNDPIRNPASVPTGRNIYLLNPDEVPSRASWELGKTLVDGMLGSYRKRHGDYPDKVAFDLSAFSTFRDYGVMEAQILYAIGVEPVWDDKNLVNDIKLIPASELKRPRIDVFISALSQYRDFFSGRMALLDKAIAMVSALDEKDNRVFQGTKKQREELLKRGVDEKKASALSCARIFGYAPGQYGNFSYYYLVERSGEWDTRQQLMETYLAQVKYVYTKDMWGEESPEAYNSAVQRTDIVLRSWSDQMTSPLSNKYTWFTGGSLASAIYYLTGKDPEFLLSDIRDPDSSSVVASEDALRQDYRTRFFNRKWIEGMKKEGYAGADQMSHMVSNTYGWKIMREKSVGDDTWQTIKSIYIDDSLNLDMKRWFDEQGPFALQEILETMLEAIRKDYWKADHATQKQLAALLDDSIKKHGEGGGFTGGGNTKLKQFKDSLLQNNVKIEKQQEPLSIPK